MNIRPKNIPKFQTGGVPQWYLNRYGNRTSLLGWDLNKRYNYSNINLNANDHRNAGDLNTVYRKNAAYTETPAVVGQDIQSFYNSDGKGMSAEDFVKFYNDNASKIRGHWAQNQTYNARTAGDHNRLFRRMFVNRSNQNQSPGSDYNIGYQEGLTKGGYDIQDIEGSSTWLRRMDQYENEFDLNDPDKNRLHEIILSDGTKATVYKKANGDIGLFKSPNDLSDEEFARTLPGTTMRELEVVANKPQKRNPVTGGNAPVSHQDAYGFDWQKITSKLQGVLPNLLAAGRLAGNLYNNERVFGEQIKGIRPDLKQSYLTHRQVVGDEATKQAYYRRAAQGQTKAAQPFTSDADRQMAYQMEAKRIGDELRAQGDLADNQEIRRTSDESNQHQWANIQRNTEVANANVAAINYANALKHNLLAQKHSANWTSWDNYLKGLEYRARQNYAEDKAFNDQLYAMQEENNLADDVEVMAAQKKLGDILKENGNDYNDPKVIEASRELKKIMNRKSIEMYERIHNRKRENNLLFAKSGTKFTYKKKDDLLYKSTRDAVEHFRKMSKISSDALNRKRIKVESLAKHPKGSTRKYQQGGVAPFTVYTPVTLGGETGMSQTTTGSTSTKSSSSGKSTDTELLDLMKNLFKEVRGLPVDVNSVYSQFNDILNRNKLFGTEMSTNDISLMYLNAMQQLNNIKVSKEIYDKALANATQNDALGEIAVTGGGQYIVQDKTGNVSVTNNLQDIMDGNVTPLTNEQLLWLRQYDPKFLLGKGDAIIQNSINNGVGINKITDELNKLAGTLGSTDETIEGFSQVESNQIKQGMKILANGALDGDYTVTEHSKQQLMQKNMALSYILRALPKNYKAILDAHAAMRGTTTPDLIETMLSSRISSTYGQTLNSISDKNGKDGSGSKSGSGSSDNSAGLSFVMGQGPREIVSFNTGTSNEISVIGIKGLLQTKSGENLGQGSTLQDATKSQQGGYLEWNKATFGGSRLNSSAYNHIILNDSTIIGMDLPVVKDFRGNEVPNFQLLKQMEQADEEIRKNNITDFNEINQIYIKHGLNPKYLQNGKLNSLNYKRFAAIQATLDEQSLENKDAILSDEVSIAGDVERDLYEEIVKKQTDNKNYSLSDGMWITGWGQDKLYKGTIFIPYSEDIAFAALSSGTPFNQDLPNNVKSIQLQQYAPKVSSYVSPQITLSQLQNN